jgi:hypothetical protein
VRGTEKRTSNIERPTSNVEWEKMKKQIYDLEEELHEHSVRIIKFLGQAPNTRAGNHVAEQLNGQYLLIQRWRFDVPMLEVHLSIKPR